MYKKVVEYIGMVSVLWLIFYNDILESIYFIVYYFKVVIGCK